MSWNESRGKIAMEYYAVNGEAPGGLGPTAVSHRDSQGLIVVDYLDLEFDVWLGGQFVVSEGCYAVTETLWNAMKSINLKGVSTRPMTVTPGDQLHLMYQGAIPCFLELVVPRSAIGEFEYKTRRRLIMQEDVDAEEQAEGEDQIILGKIERQSIPEADMFSGRGLPLIVTSRVRDFLKNYGGVRLFRSHRVEVVG